MNDKEFNLSVDSNVMEVIKTYPQAAEIFMKHGLPCVGCAAARYEAISDVASEFDIDAKQLILEIEKAVSHDKLDVDQKK